MGGQLTAVGGIVAGHMGDDDDAAFGYSHHVLQQQLALGNRLIDAFTGGAAHIQAHNSLADQILRQRPDPLGGNVSLLVVAGVEGGENPLVFA